MNSLIIHGCYDATTLKTLIDFGIKDFAFDLRGRSQNLIPFKDLNELLKFIKNDRAFLTFENDRIETIHSFLNLLSQHSMKFVLIFRDQQEAVFYSQVHAPFLWMFHPAGDWRSILKLENLKGIILPLKWQDQYQKLPDLWKLIDARNLDVYLHAENFEESLSLDLAEDLKFSLDLSPEIESGFRQVDQSKLRGMKIWRKLNENSARE